MTKGWFLESPEHSMAARGISLGRNDSKGKFKNLKTKFDAKESEKKVLEKNDNVIYQRIKKDLGHTPSAIELSDAQITAKDKFNFHVAELRKLADEDVPDPQAVAYHSRQVKHYRAVLKRQGQERLIHASNKGISPRGIRSVAVDVKKRELRERVEEPLLW